MINITFPDKSVRKYNDGVTGAEIAGSISPRLAKEVLSITVIALGARRQARATVAYVGARPAVGSERWPRAAPASREECGDADLVGFALEASPMVDVVGTKTHLGRMQRAAAAGDADCLAGTGIADPESQVGSALRPGGEP